MLRTKFPSYYMPIPAFYCDHFQLPLPAGHTFPMVKYRKLRDRLATAEVASQLEFTVPDAATDNQLALVHDPDYIAELKSGSLDPIAQKRIGFPWSEQMVERSRRSTGATIAAARAALHNRYALNLAGGTHHAFADHGQGYCVFNDVAVAIRVLQQEGLAERCVVIDCDVHQGNGTAHIFRNDDSVFTFSMHADRNFPHKKCNGDLDIALPTGTEDDEYLERLEHAVRKQIPLVHCEMVFYVSGADAFLGDCLGKLKLTKEGLRRRDELLFDIFRQLCVPVVTMMGGGYAKDVDDIVDIHENTVRTVLSAASRT
ncbi:MAG: acetoin utilization deacetylase AcuC-like enzyme [Pirellulaceae bacterium]|jgi:acetoin utilization deacetylase AcuC-like enzyme